MDTKIRAITDSNQQYLAHADVSRAIASVPGSASVALAHPLFDANLIPASLRAYLPTSFSMLTDPAVRSRYNENFVVHEMQKFDGFFSNLGGFSLSQEQREACTHYQKLIGVCIKHIRASQLTLEMLLERAKSLHDKPRAQYFARAVWLITQAYSRKLDEAKRIDFDSMSRRH
ncbi:hypothetical protein [Sphingobium xenophagum]|uniref:hypothetical protein n=1 Tax=Sphingobium xenophagum TaxID=121428 RepID=UPI0003A6B8AA|nr:hypothetical protein [Sphingobium xenophagum]